MFESLNDTLLVSDQYESLSYTELRRLAYPKWAHRIVGTLLCMLWTLGLLFNSSALITFYRNRKLWSPTNTFVIGLALSDTAIILFGVPWSAINALNGSWFTGHITCIIEAFVLYSAGMSSCYLLMAISIDRYIAIVKPLKAQQITQTVAIKVVCLCFLGGLFLATLPLFGLSSYGLEAPGVSCGLNYEDQSLSTTIYIFAIFIFAFILPLAIMVFCYANVYLMVRRIARSSYADISTKEAQKSLQFEKNTLRSSVIMCGVYWTCWLPYALVSFWTAFGDANTIPIFVTAIPAAAAKTSFVWNPLIYVATNQRFRLAFYDLLPVNLRESLLQREHGDQLVNANGSKAEREVDAPANGHSKVDANLKPPVIEQKEGETSSEQVTTVDEMKSFTDMATDKCVETSESQKKEAIAGKNEHITADSTEKVNTDKTDGPDGENNCDSGVEMVAVHVTRDYIDIETLKVESGNQAAKEESGVPRVDC